MICSLAVKLAGSKLADTCAARMFQTKSPIRLGGSASCCVSEEPERGWVRGQSCFSGDRIC